MNKIEDQIKGAIQLVKEKTVELGGKEKNDFIFRDNTISASLEKGDAYFGLIRPEEEPTGPYNDFSYVVFPSEGKWLVALGVGSMGFRNDYDIAMAPGIRRLFRSITNKEGFCKTSFADIENNLPKDFRDRIPELCGVFDKYGKVLIACNVIDNPISDEGKKRILGYLAAYADLRNWPANQKQRDVLKNIIKDVKVNITNINNESEVFKLIKNRRFVVLQGAPGTGKTRLAKRMVEILNISKVFFTQFSAQTTYSDFVYGIRPDINNTQLTYKENEGIFRKSLKYANDNPNESILLIIDEINRANLANVLGPIFYLFEYEIDLNSKNKIEIEIGDNFWLEKIPENFYVISTMNTADRSLAIVDFALRRRFAWYTIKPEHIDNKNLKKGLEFFKDDFDFFENNFQWYATSEELNLQPGQGYFIAKDDESMKDRLRYELLPLMKEYFIEGIMQTARDSFVNYFYDRIGIVMFE